MIKNIWGTLGWLAVILIAVIALMEGWLGSIVGRIFIYGLIFVVAAVILFPIGYMIGKKRIKKDHAVIAESSEDFLATITHMKASGQSYNECMSYLRSKGIGKSTAESIIANAVVELNAAPAGQGKNPETQHQKTNVIRFLEQTQKQWRAGAFSELSNAFAAEAQATPQQKFVDTYMNILGPIAKECFSVVPLQADEILIAFVEEGFLLTNKRLYIFHPQCPEPNPRTIHCRDIQDYQVKGTLTFTLTITLKSGEILTLRKLDTIVDKTYIHQLIEKGAPA